MLLEKVRPERLDKKQDTLHIEDIAYLKEHFPNLITVGCVACGSLDYRQTFTKMEYAYNRCKVCNTLFLSPRLSKEGLAYFFSNAKSMKFRATDLYTTVAKERKKNIFVPRWRIIKKALDRLSVSFPIPNVLEVGASVGLFASVVLEKKHVINYDVIEPLGCVAEPLGKIGIREIYVGVEDCFVGKIPPIYNVIFCNGVLEHPFSPVEFVSNLKTFLKPDGLLVICSPGGSGIDSLILKGNQPNAVPPHMQNFISNEGWRYLSQRCKMKLVNFQSIGQLDMDIIYSQLVFQNSEYHTLLSNGVLRSDIQKTLQKYSLTGFYLTILQNSIGS